MDVYLGKAAKAHCHGGFETAIYVLKGRVLCKYGDKLARSALVEAGDFLYIGPGVWHQPINLSPTEEAVRRNAANERSRRVADQIAAAWRRKMV